ncbi:unnamed protein product [Trichogramma brassicae]|uniref:Uncharacterized protein n=1 Tax=Trichogramma brassicae TaxID=86971 RepID=A0A6H5J4R6_9HYME|nr:unnamed protein product [Trichogramma brassicae]
MYYNIPKACQDRAQNQRHKLCSTWNSSRQPPPRTQQRHQNAGQPASTPSRSEPRIRGRPTAPASRRQCLAAPESINNNRR